MASGLYNLQSSVLRNLSRCMKHSNDLSSSFHKSRWRSIATLALCPDLVEAPCPAEVRPHTQDKRVAAILSLKEKERGDWRNLTLEEKQELYCMSFSQPFSNVIEQPADEWKLILAGAFTTMGLMTLGMYMWLSQSDKAECAIGPLSPKTELKNTEEISLLYGSELEKVA